MKPWKKFLLAAAVTALSAAAGEDAPAKPECGTAVVVFLPGAGAGVLPGQEFFDVIKAAVEALETAVGDRKEVILCGGELEEKYARVILNSFGFTTPIVNPSAARVSLLGCGKILAAGKAPGDTEWARLPISAIPMPAATAPPVHSGKWKPRSAAIVLGNEPLDETTPTIDMVRRVVKAVEFARSEPDALLVMTGGATAGDISEARMMGLMAAVRGVHAERIALEERARSTRENALLTAPMLAGGRFRRTVVISKPSHLEWAIEIFRKQDVFRAAEPLPCAVSDEDIVAQMKDYLRRRPSGRVQRRLENLLGQQKGTD
ncbi:MAG: YdcF family protein [Planctomycetes bacterium]|nr:YdcF family protein [Planctomycetota bacterium]